MTVKFADDASKGENLLQVSISGDPKFIQQRLREIANEFDTAYGKPCQGIVSQFGEYTHVITPIWHGKQITPIWRGKQF